SHNRRRLYLIIEKIAARWANKIICVSEYDRKLALKHSVGLPEQLVTVHNGIPVLEDIGVRRLDSNNKVKMIMVARFSEPKDQQLLVKAASQLQTENDFEIDFVGDGPLFSSTKELAQKLQISDKVRFLGACTDVPELLENADVFVLTSNWEGFPITILEAMRAGLPVITSDVGGCNEAVIDGVTGYLIPRGDQECLKERLARLINDSQLRSSMGNKGFERFSEYFTVEQMAQKTMAVYESILADYKRPNI
ncbi:MAG TPA: glycosyltransferase family 4 protein, partial [Syntrophomonadaceae bacterium]|nr:glycosyltransferase family 4 protein [Syntrophomonadaceae bacterium]